jgi:hypothetical protein
LVSSRPAVFSWQDTTTAVHSGTRKLSLFRAAELAGDASTAAARYGELVELTENGDPDTESLRHAREFVSSA